MSIYPLTYSQHLKLKYGNFKNDISDLLIQMIFDGKTENSVEIERKILNIYTNIQNYDVYEWKNFLQFGGFPSSLHEDNNEITKKSLIWLKKLLQQI